MTNPRANPRLIDRQGLEDMALVYVARFATSAVKLDAYLRRKLRERGWAGDEEPPVAAIVARFVAAGYIDDAAYARAKTGSLLRRGYGARRIAQVLGAAGIAEDVRADARTGAGEERRAALALARKRGFGPFGRTLPDRAVRERQVAAMLRAGHPLDSARKLVDAADQDAALEWAAQADEES
jgi:regulatory protein